MKEQADYFPSDLCSGNLLTIQEINFTPREVDIMACLAGARGTSKIASLLTIAPKTVVNHIRNIMMKIDCNSREGIIDFLEKSNKLTFLRKYYADLILRADFDKKLKEISKFTKGHNSSFKIIYLENEETHKQLSTLLNIHLEQLGLSVSTETRLEGAPLSHFLTRSYTEEYVVYILSAEDAKEVSVTYAGQNPSQSHNLENRPTAKV
ncbi:MAG: helix-turn-helix transcriptional regulator [Alphaproteobacteria bacterium]|nr:helix-turn-helix transcriptional regulator [Alphaproteobacteria bacterium]